MIGGVVLLLIGSRLVVWGGVGLGQALGLSELIIGLTIVAVGTSLPGLATSIAGIVKKTALHSRGQCGWIQSNQLYCYYWSSPNPQANGAGRCSDAP